MEDIKKIRKKLMDATAAAKYIGITKAALLRRADAGDLPCAVFPGFRLFLRCDVVAYKQKREKDAREREKRDK